MKAIAVVLLMLGLSVPVLVAQEQDMRPEVRPWVSATIPISDQRGLFQQAPAFGVQGALEIQRNLHVVGSFAWMPGRSKYVVANPHVNVLEYNAGVEVGLVRPLAGRWDIKPFLGLGGGRRTYLYDAPDLRDRSGTSSYGAVGAEFQLANTALRLESRWNLFYFGSPVTGGEPRARSDLWLSLGLAYHIH